MSLVELQTYASIAWDSEDIIEIRPLQRWTGERVWCRAGNLEEHYDRMKAENENGANIYAGILPRNKYGGGTASDVDNGHVAWGDLDECNPETAIGIANRIGLPDASMVISSGHGTHLIWRFAERQSKETICGIVQEIINLFLADEEGSKYIDKGAKDAARILRLPGFINHKPPKATASIFRSEYLTYSPNDFPSLKHKTIQAPSASPMPVAESAREERARKYLSMIEGSAPGGRTNTAFRAACVLVNDLELPDSTAIQMLSAWDSASNSPSIATDYGPEEIEKIIANAKKYHKKTRGALLTPTVTVAENPANVNGADISGILSQKKETTYETFPEEYLFVPGFVDAVMRHNLAIARKPQPVLALASALSLQAVLCARKVTDEYGCRPNVYICCVADSGSGKDTGRQLNKQILLESGQGHLQSEGIKSGSALINALVTQPAILFQVDEYGRFIRSINYGRDTHRYEIVDKLLTLYTSSNSVYESDRYADEQKGGKQINCPHAILYGTTVPRSLYGGLTDESISDGFLSRTLVFDICGNDPKRRRSKILPIPKSIMDVACFWRDYVPPGSGNLNPEPRVIEETKCASEIKMAFIDTEHAEQITLADDPRRTLWTRTAENGDKLALLYSVSRDHENPIIDEEATKWGYGLAEWLTRRLMSLVSDNVSETPFHADCLRAKKYIMSQGGTIFREDLMRYMHKKVRELDEIILHLMQSNEIIENVEQTSGRPKRVYRIIC